MTLDLTRRLVKGSPLTAAEHDGNLDELEDAIENIPLVSTANPGLAPATGTPSGKYLKDDGTWADVAGGSPAGTGSELQFRSSGSAFGAVTGSSVDASGNVTLASRLINSVNNAASAPPLSLTGSWTVASGTATTYKPAFLIEPAGTTSTGWSTAGTGLGVNAPSGFTGSLLDLQVNGTSRFRVLPTGCNLGASPTITGTGTFDFQTGATGALFRFNATISGTSFTGQFFGNSVNSFNGGPITFSGTNVGFGSNFAGGDCLVNGGQGRGTGAGGAIVFSTSDSGASGGTLNPLAERLRITSSGILQIADGVNFAAGTTTGTKIGTATTQRLGFFNATPVVQPTAVADITTTATTGSLPTPNGTVTIADAAAPTSAELLEYCVELEVKLEAALSRLRDLGLIAT